MLLNPEFSPEALLGGECEKTQFPGSDIAISGYRYYNPKDGRFINKDPKEEAGGLNLYGFCGNDGVNKWDYLGMDPNILPGDLTFALNSVDSGPFCGPVVEPVAPGDSGPTTAPTSTINASGSSPASTFYGLGASPDTPEAIRQLIARMGGGGVSGGSNIGGNFDEIAGGSDWVSLGNHDWLTYAADHSGDSTGGVLGALQRLAGGVEGALQAAVSPLGGAVAPNCSGYTAPDNCAIITVQKIQAAMGLHIDSRETIIRNFGLPASNFESGGDGLTDPDRNTTQLLNAALNPSGLAVDHVPQGFDFATLVAKGNPLILGTQAWDSIKNDVVLHMVAGVPNGPNNTTITIYNPTGSDGSVTYTPQQSLEHNIPTNSGGQSGKVWYVYEND